MKISSFKVKQRLDDLIIGRTHSRDWARFYEDCQIEKGTKSLTKDEVALLSLRFTWDFFVDKLGINSDFPYDLEDLDSEGIYLYLRQAQNLLTDLSDAEKITYFQDLERNFKGRYKAVKKLDDFSHPAFALQSSEDYFISGDDIARHSIKYFGKYRSRSQLYYWFRERGVYFSVHNEYSFEYLEIMKKEIDVKNLNTLYK